MTLVTGTVQDLGYDGMEGTLWARPARFRSDGQVVYAPERKPYKVVDGVVSADLAPGPAVLELQVGSHARGTFEVVIPEEDTTLADLLDTVFAWEPAQVSLFVAEREAAELAKAEAEAAAGQAATAASTATSAAQQTGQDRSHVDQVRTELDEAFDESTAGNVLPPRLTEAALNATYGEPINAIKPDGNVRAVGKSELAINIRDFGAVGNDADDDTAAIQAAYDQAVAQKRPLYFPGGNYRVSTLNFLTGVTIYGDGPGRSEIRGRAGEVIRLAGYNHDWSNISVRAWSGTAQAQWTGGTHTVVIPAGMSLAVSRFSKVDFGGRPDSNLWRSVNDANTVGGLYDVHWIDCTFTHSTSGTVNPILVRGGHCFSANRFTRCRYYACGRHFVSVEIIKANVYAYNNAWDSINFEICNGGGISITSGLNSGLRNLGFFDMGVVTNNLITFDRMATSAGDGLAKGLSRGNVIENYHRSGGSLSEGVSDIALSTSAQATTIIGAGGPPSAGVKIDLKQTDAVVLGHSDSIATIVNENLDNTVVLSRDGTRLSNIAHRGTLAGFYGSPPVARPTGVPVTAAGVHAALVQLGLIAP